MADLSFSDPLKEVATHGNPPGKFVQICVSDSRSGRILLALDDRGRVWQKFTSFGGSSWEQIND